MYPGRLWIAELDDDPPEVAELDLNPSWRRAVTPGAIAEYTLLLLGSRLGRVTNTGVPFADEWMLRIRTVCGHVATAYSSA